MIRVLIVDASPTACQVVRLHLAGDPTLVVAGEAHNTEEALALIQRLQPDVLTVDVTDGFETVRRVMEEAPRPIVALSSCSEDQWAEVQAKATEAGALTLFSKPTGLPVSEASSSQLIAQAKLMAGVKVIRRRWHLFEAHSQRSEPVRLSSPVLRTSRLVRLIAIGVSTGGPPALQVIFKGLPATLPCPIVVVQHISRGFIEGLAAWLGDTTQLKVKVGHAGELLMPGKIYLAPDNYHLLVKAPGVIWLDPSPPVNGLRPTANALFESVAQAYGAEAVGVLLTGMGDDGARGLKALRAAGGYTMAQDEASSVIFGMPREAIIMDAVDEIVNLKDIAARLQMLVKSGRK